MWSSAFSAVQSAVSSVWVWFNGLFDSLPGAWEFVSYVIIICLIVKHILAPLTGAVFTGGLSDTVPRRRGATPPDQKKYGSETKRIGAKS